MWFWFFFLIIRLSYLLPNLWMAHNLFIKEEFVVLRKFNNASHVGGGKVEMFEFRHLPIHLIPRSLQSTKLHL